MEAKLKGIARMVVGAEACFFSIFLLIHLLLIKQTGSVTIYENNVLILNFEIVFMTILSILLIVHTYTEFKEGIKID